MRKNGNLQHRWKAAPAVLVLLMAFLIGLTAECFVIVSHAESEGKVTANSAKIRQEPSTDSTSLGSAMKDAKVSIRGKTTGADGKVWYQVFVDADTLGYIRSDLVEITDGSTPADITPDTGTPGTPTTSDPGPDETLVAVTAVNPVSASVKGGQAVRVRQNASTTSRIVTTAQSGLVLNVVGTAVGTDGNNWYQVSYISNSSEVSGFIRSDYIELSGELVPVSTEVPPEVSDPPVEVDPILPPVTEDKDWDTYYEGEKWHLIDNITGDSYDIQDIFTKASENKEIALNALDAKKKQQVVIVILVILLIGLAALATYLIFRIKDMMDSAYFSEVERETIRRRSADRPQGSGQKVMHTVGEDRRPAGQRPSGNSQGQRPAGQRPSGSGQGQRPAGQRPSEGSGGQRPAGGNGQGQRPAGQRPPGSGQGQRPAGQRPSEGNGGQGQRPSGGGGNSQGQRPAGQRPEGAPAQPKSDSQDQGWKSKNFMADDDDFKFLGWDETEDE